jgi:hypothetical protein
MQVALGTSPNCLSRQYQASAGDKFGWQNGLTSRCVPVTWLFNTYAYQFPDSTYKDGWRDSMCYQSSCSAEGVLQLDILGNKVNCPSGQMVDLSKVSMGVQLHAVDCSYSTFWTSCTSACVLALAVNIVARVVPSADSVVSVVVTKLFVACTDGSTVPS